MKFFFVIQVGNLTLIRKAVVSNSLPQRVLQEHSHILQYKTEAFHEHLGIALSSTVKEETT